MGRGAWDEGRGAKGEGRGTWGVARGRRGVGRRARDEGNSNLRYLLNRNRDRRNYLLRHISSLFEFGEIYYEKRIHLRLRTSLATGDYD